MPYLIDGNNLIGHIPYLRLDDPKSKYHLVAQLMVFQRIKKRKVILVFDGPPDLELLGEKYRSKKFLIIFPIDEENADAVIETWIEKQTNFKHFSVVSSDREIKAFAHLNKAKVIDCDNFYKELKSILKKFKLKKSMKKTQIQLSPLEIRHWLEIFESKNE
jgi:predicted RNA-binding protein with PIN domain